MKLFKSLFLFTIIFLFSINIVLAFDLDSCQSGDILTYQAEGNGFDSSGSYDGTLRDGGFYGAGKVGFASFSFDGIDDYFISNSTGPQFEKNTSFTISLWVNLTADTIIISNVDCNDALQGFSITTGYGGTTFIGLSANPGAPDGIGGEGPSLVLGEWQHLVVAYNGTNTEGEMEVYLNNVYQGEYVGTIAGSTVGNDEIKFGQQCGAGFGQMQIDQVQIYNKKLTPDEVSILWNSGNGLECPLYNAPPFVINQQTITENPLSFDLFILFLIMAIVLIILGLIFPLHSELALLGFGLLFVLSIIILFGNIEHKIGTMTYEMNATSIFTEDIYSNYTINGALNHIVGYLLAIVSIVGFAGVLFNLKRGF